MSLTLATCPQCGAKPREFAQRTCEFCGFELPLPKPEPAVEPPQPSGAARLRAIEASAAFGALAEHVPESGVSAASALPLLFLIPWLLIGGFVIRGFHSMSPAAALFPLAIVGVGVIVILRKALGPLVQSSGPVERRAALVLDKRVEISGGDSSHTSYFVTLVDVSDARKEFSAEGPLYGTLAQGDAGAAFARGDRLLEFRRIDA